MAALHDLVDHCDRLLKAGDFQDYCPNGLQVEGRGEVRLVVSGVTACQALIDAAAEAGADLLLVHHGFFWKGEPQPLVGMKGRRIRRLIDSGMSLLAYHLPLDAHESLGNNAQLAERLGLHPEGRLDEQGIGWVGRVEAETSLAELAARVGQALGREPLAIDGGGHPIRRIGWCSGAAQSWIDRAADAGLDAFLSGEISEQTVHVARERGIHYLACGHHATERYGVQALGAHLAAEFGLEHRFIDIDNPV